MALPTSIQPRYQAILDQCEPFLVSWTGNWPHLDLEPFGIPIPNVVSATRLDSRPIVDGLHRLDAATFADQDMLMPRWVLFDCGEFPGIVFGFGRRAQTLPAPVRAHYQVPDDETFVPLSMWVAIPCAEPHAWFGHNLSSANVLPGDHQLPGLGTLTKVFGVAVTRARWQYGATQWTSKSLGIHLTMGDLELLSAYTPAHTHAETFSYRLPVDHQRLQACMAQGWDRPHQAPDRWLDADDIAGIRELHTSLEAGQRFSLTRVRRGNPGSLGLAHLGDA